MDKKSIIWNLTRQCAWNCTFCCVDANYIGSRRINFSRDCDFHPEEELSFNEKIKVLENIDIPARIDFSGGELLLDPLNTELIIHASKKIGKENIGISTSGIFIDEDWIHKILNYVNDVELTLDKIPFSQYKYRPIGYHEYTANAVRLLKKNNIYTGIQTVLTKQNADEKNLYELYNWLVHNNVDEWSILKYFPSGRGENIQHLKLSESEYINVVEYLKNIKSKIKIHFQYLLPNHKEKTECRAVKKSIGILPSGDCISCFWALSKHAKLKDEKFLLGNLLLDKLSNLLQSKVAKYWQGITKCVLQ